MMVERHIAGLGMAAGMTVDLAVVTLHSRLNSAQDLSSAQQKGQNVEGFVDEMGCQV